MAYCARNGIGPAQLYIRSLDEFQARAVAGCGSNYGPFFSPDGEWVGFFAENKLQRVSVAGGAPIAIADALGDRGGSWGEDDTIVFGRAGVGLLRVSARGGKPQTLLASEDATIGYRQAFPQALPGGKNVLFTTLKSDPRFENRARIGVLSLETGGWHIVLRGAECARFAESGHLLYAAGESGLRAVPFDLERLEVSGNPISILEDVFYNYGAGRAPFALSEAGTLAYVPGSRAERTLVWVDREENFEIFSVSAGGTGELKKLLEKDFTQRPKSWSPDGKVLAFEHVSPATGSDIWMLPLEGEPSPFLAAPYNERSPRFSPDGRFLAYTSDESGRYEVYVLPYPGPGDRWAISTEGGTAPVWSRDGKELFYRHGDEMIAVAVTTDRGFSVGASRVLFRGRYLSGVTAHYDVSPDGQSFLMVRRDRGSIPARINIVLNWLEELKRLAPAT